jgi:NTP pyrophosphatase (non-canonical NTP hydrolase)
MKKVQINHLYKEIWKKFGDLQYVVFMEECAELIKAISKYARNKHVSAQASRDLVEEIADVEIMIEQVIKNHNWEKFRNRIDTAKHDKHLRLKQLLKGVEE